MVDVAVPDVSGLYLQDFMHCIAATQLPDHIAVRVLLIKCLVSLSTNYADSHDIHDLCAKPKVL